MSLIKEFLRCQTPTSTVRLKVEGCRVKNVGCRIKSEGWRVGGQGGGVSYMCLKVKNEGWGDHKSV